ncbi:lipopolysaccharide biosynthesis protein [Aquabacterium sp. OR-4]|uniref:lipopolysaccharide biosynthesis protein n=1 Tax=Aquabacterium sp. OR-4 TaxID=2978127 RepID=UPI0021B468F4|nr:hypothetical protein [Aquabacterium sp. OR-4]MDT7834493.1 hypothetical protein [Aquabacterium sp. OR-4]
MSRLLSVAAGLDRAVVYALAARVWSLLASFVTLALVVRFLSAEEQGYYYTFSAIVGAQILFELGLGVVVTQFASHAMARLHWLADGRLGGDPGELARLSSLFKLVLRWYGLLTLVIVAVLGPTGWWFITSSAKSATVQWEAAWFWLIAAAALNLVTQPVMSLLEGCQCVAQVARLRLIQGVLGSIVAWFTLLGGGGLLALPAWNSAMALSAVAMLLVVHGPFFRQMRHHATSAIRGISWRHEIWPFQWRIALSWISGYFIFQLFVPVLFSAQGPVEAGRMGLSLAIANALMGLPLAWLNTKVPRFGQLIAQRDYAQLDKLWRRTTLATLGLLCAGGVAVVGLVHVLQTHGMTLGGRLLASGPFALLVLATVSNYIMIAQAAYLRAHKEEPFLVVSLASGASIAASTLLLAGSYGATGIMAGYLVCSLSCGLAWGSVIFVNRRRAYRAAATASP